jgi:hypothetical protein
MPIRTTNSFGAYVELATGDKMQTGKAISRKRGADGDVKGVANTNPILNSRTYEVEFTNGEVTESQQMSSPRTCLRCVTWKGTKFC